MGEVYTNPPKVILIHGTSSSIPMSSIVSSFSSDSSKSSKSVTISLIAPITFSFLSSSVFGFSVSSTFSEITVSSEISSLISDPSINDAVVFSESYFPSFSIIFS